MILILGVGRSGTSDVARILSEMGVNMGKCDRKDINNPQGYFEDEDFVRLNNTYIHMTATGAKDWLPKWREYFKRLSQREEPWGVKDPNITQFKGLIDEYLTLNPQVIVCTRNRKDTVKSIMNCYGMTQKNAKRLYDTRMDNIKTIPNYLEIDCYSPWKSTFLKQSIKKLTR